MSDTATTEHIRSDDEAVPGSILQTERLRLRLLTEADAAFMCALLNSPAFVQNIGDRGVRSLEDAARYLREGALAAYAQHGFGMYLVELRGDATPVGLCGLVRREGLDADDIGFAFLPEHCGCGFGSESAAAVLAYARDTLRLPRLVAIVLEANVPSVRLLQRLGLRYERTLRLPGGNEDLQLYAIDWPR